MREGMLHIRDVEGPKKTGSVETRLKVMEQEVFKCQGMVERGLNANHMMITEFTNKHMIDANDIGKHLSTRYDRIDQLQAQIYDLQNQNCRIRTQLQLPIAFAKVMREEKLPMVRLHVHGCGNGAAPVTVEQPGPRLLFLDRGWKSFARAHNI
ncbi:40S ribosomal protein S5-1 [Hordeum vulgare]|nr:40S ribosomal protein S5-1 [Hordeum vulgare]